jgi:hypothetical protein
MRRIFGLFILILCLPFGLLAQPNLAAPINSPGLPADSTFIAPYNFYFDTTNLFVQSGFHPGDQVPDFTLYDTASAAYNLSTLLSDGKPLLLITVSLTCPSSRSGMVNVLPDLITLYGTQVHFLMVYTLDAHPLNPDLCPYTATINTLQQNYLDTILYHQAVRYAHRKQMAKRFLQRYNTTASLVLDDPANNYWNNFGPAPNNAYLITPGGTVFTKYGWFSREKPLIIQDIALLLATVGTNELPASNSISLYPNPSDGNATISVNTNSEWSYFVRDLSGKLIYSEEHISSNSEAVSAAELASGMYLVEVVTAEERRQLRFVRN